MKIISKYKDFYDFIVQDHDADITYVRYIGLVNESFDKLFQSDDRSTHYFNNNYGYSYSDYSWRHSKDGDVTFGNYIFGIYPFVYSQPYIDVMYTDICGHEENVRIILPKSIVDGLLNIETRTDTTTELITLIWSEFDKVQFKSEKPFKLTYNNKSLYDSSFHKNLKRYVWKVDCPEIFYKIESPVFVKDYNELFIDGAYYNNWPEDPRVGNGKYTHYVTDICFSKLNKNILKYWYDDLFDINTYINIENFLWSIKQEPEAMPDNKTKIMAHGFDLKTSFRKM